MSGQLFEGFPFSMPIDLDDMNWKGVSGLREKSIFGDFCPLFKRDGGRVDLYKQSCKRSSDAKTRRISFGPLVRVLPTVSLWYFS